MRSEDELKIDDIVECLRGTCMNNVEQAIEDIHGVNNDLTQDEKDLIEEKVYEELFVCDNCGWWCEIGSQSSDVFEHDGNDEVCEECEDEYLDRN